LDSVAKLARHSQRRSRGGFRGKSSGDARLRRRRLTDSRKRRTRRSR